MPRFHDPSAGERTDDADDLGLSPEFLADEDIAREEDEYERACGRPRCGGPVSQGTELVGGCPGCRYCDPPDHECKPYGWGIESFEDPALAEANRRVTNGWFGGPYRRLPCPRETRDAIWCRLSTRHRRRERHSDIVWDRLCDEAETHREAVARYTAWAARAVTRRYRDELPAGGLFGRRRTT